ncbi:NAD(+) diphosphatase [Primorskyibacter sp. 2E107]|uniref:NAD(+) diphosphatase n=1 Tax=Primorskyibacter sp. 2E107 TaxID=3403458 RepID=UPI003AF4D43F
MKIAEQVTFGGSGLDRAAELRSDIPALAAAMQEPATRCIVLWRGKPLIAGETMFDLLRLPMDHPVLAEAREAPMLLGREAGAAVFAHDISGWEPEVLDEALGNSFSDTSEQVHPALDAGQRFRELRTMLTRLNARDAELATTAKAMLNWHGSHGFCARCGAASVIHQAGWQRICPECGAHHFPRTDPVVIMLITHGNRCLLGRSHGWPEGMFSCLAGFVEPGEPIEAAVRREVYEEAAVRVGAVRYLASQPWAFPSSLMFGCHGEAVSEEIRVDPVELDDARWVTREELADVFAGLRTDMLPARPGAIAHFLLRNWLADRLD